MAGLRAAGIVAVGLAVGVGVMVVAPGLYRAARPMLRTGLRVGLDALKRGRTLAAGALEDVEDLIAEARADLEARRTARAEAPEPGPHAAP